MHNTKYSHNSRTRNIKIEIAKGFENRVSEGAPRKQNTSNISNISKGNTIQDKEGILGKQQLKTRSHRTSGTGAGLIHKSHFIQKPKSVFGMEPKEQKSMNSIIFENFWDTSNSKNGERSSKSWF